MIILLKSTSDQMISFIPRILEAYSVTIINQANNIEVVYTPEFYTNDYYLTCSIIFDLIELQTYTLIVKDNNGNLFFAGLAHGLELTGGTITTGAQLGDHSGYTIELSGAEPLPASFLEGALSTVIDTITVGT